MKKLLTVGVAILLATAGFTFIQSQSTNCVAVYMDYGSLSDAAPSTTCIPVYETTNALDLLASAGLLIEGTQEYGNAIVCRVNGKPDATVESCESMPPAEAYWAIIIKERQIIPFPLGIGSAWGWAQTGVNEIKLDAGDSIGLVFADNGDVRFP